MKTTSAEEDYLKAIFKHTQQEATVATNALAQELGTSPASVTDMLKKLSEKGLVAYAPYRGVSLSALGRSLAVDMLRKHRLWEVFLFDKLQFTWDEIHELAEELEHIRSKKLTNRLEEFLGFPRFDPHGEPIPDAEGNIAPHNAMPLSEVPPGTDVVIVAVAVQETDFLRYLDRIQVRIGTRLRVLEHIDFDASRLLLVADRELMVNHRVAQYLEVSPL